MFFVGGLFVVYGVLILGAGIFMASPPDVKMQHLHIWIWWGALLLAMGLFFTIRFWPTRKTLAGESDREPEKE